MKQLCEPIIETGITQFNNLKTRTTVRGIIIKDNQVLMVYSPQFNDYTFPGGGKKETESYEHALIRELKEELGADYVYDIKPYGTLTEYRYGLNQNDQIYKQTSHYYLCEVGSLGKQELAERELVHGVIPVWVDIEIAIKHNQSVMGDNNHSAQGLTTVLKRENIVLNDILINLTRYFKVVNQYQDQQIQLPKRATKRAAGYDLAAAAKITIKPQELILVPTGLKVHLLKDEVLLLYPRSSLALKKQLMIPNSVGVIDADYYENETNEGHIFIPLYNLGKTDVVIEKGERIAQGIFQKYLLTVDDDANQNRKGGFGSTD